MGSSKSINLVLNVLLALVLIFGSLYLLRGCNPLPAIDGPDTSEVTR